MLVFAIGMSIAISTIIAIWNRRIGIIIKARSRNFKKGAISPTIHKNRKDNASSKKII
jgi:hypothetical protein